MNPSEFPIQPVGARPGNQTWVNTFSQRRYSSDMVGLPIVGLGAVSAIVDPAHELMIANQLVQLQKCMTPGDYAGLYAQVQLQLAAAHFPVPDTRNPGGVTYASIEQQLVSEIQFRCADHGPPTLLYVGIGVGVLALAGGAWWLLKRH